MSLYVNFITSILYLGIICSTLIGSVMVNLPMIIGGISFIALAVILVFLMKETNFTPSPAEGRNSWQQMAHTFTEGIKFIKGKPLLLPAVMPGQFGQFMVGLFQDLFAYLHEFPVDLRQYLLQFLHFLRGCH